MCGKMRRFCPRFQSLEERTVLSFSFSHLLHSVFPFVPDKSSKATPGAAYRARLAMAKAEAANPALVPAPAHVHAVHHGHVRAQIQHPNPSQAVTPAIAHPRGTFNWYAANPTASRIKVR